MIAIAAGAVALVPTGPVGGANASEVAYSQHLNDFDGSAVITLRVIGYKAKRRNSYLGLREFEKQGIT